MLKMTKLKKDMEFNKTLGGVLEALKGVASAEYFRLQSERKTLSDFELSMKGFFENMDIGGMEHVFFNTAQGPKNIVLITSDASFLGKLNISVVQSALEQYVPGDMLTVIGRQGARYIEEMGKEQTSFPGIDDNISFESMISLKNHIIKSFYKKKLTGTVIIYPHFISFSSQVIQQLQVFPCRFLFPDSGPEKLSPRHGLDRFWKPDPDEEIIIEPSKKSIVEYLVRVWLTRSIHQIFWESKLSEWAARVIHLEKSVNEIKRQDKTLRLKYFRFLHQASDQNIREIFCNRLVLMKEA
jgi:ATP synthase F1 gamma subunit